MGLRGPISVMAPLTLILDLKSIVLPDPSTWFWCTSAPQRKRQILRAILAQHVYNLLSKPQQSKWSRNLWLVCETPELDCKSRRPTEKSLCGRRNVKRGLTWLGGLLFSGNMNEWEKSSTACWERMSSSCMWVMTCLLSVCGLYSFVSFWRGLGLSGRSRKQSLRTFELVRCSRQGKHGHMKRCFCFFLSYFKQRHLSGAAFLFAIVFLF